MMTLERRHDLITVLKPLFYTLKESVPLKVIFYKRNRPHLLWFTGVITHLGFCENTRNSCKSLAFGSWFTSFSHVLPTSPSVILFRNVVLGHHCEKTRCSVLVTQAHKSQAGFSSYFENALPGMLLRSLPVHVRWIIVVFWLSLTIWLHLLIWCLERLNETIC